MTLLIITVINTFRLKRRVEYVEIVKITGSIAVVILK